MDEPDGNFDEESEPLLAVITVPELSEFELRQRVGQHSSEYDAFIEHALEAPTLLDTVIRLQEREAGFVVEALVHQLLTCAPDEREIFRDLAIGVDGRSDLAIARLSAAAQDATVDWDLRVHCFMLEAFCNPVAPSVKRLDPSWTAVPEDEWRRLLRDYHREVIVRLEGTPDALASAAVHFSPDDWADVLDDFRRRGVELDCRAILDDDRLRPLWLTAVDELAAVGAADIIPRVEEMVEWFAGEEQVRIRRALMRLRAACD